MGKMINKFQKSWILVIAILVIFSTNIFAAEDMTTLEKWIEKAINENSQYQLDIKEYQTAIKKLELEDRYGLKLVNISDKPLALRDGELEVESMFDLSYNGELPREITMQGKTFRYSNLAGEKKIKSTLNFSVDPLDLLNPDIDPATKIGYLDARHKLYQQKYQLISKVVNKYNQILNNEKELDIMDLKIRLKKSQLKESEARLESGQISKADYHRAEDEMEDLLDERARLERELERAIEEFGWIYPQDSIDTSSLVEEMAKEDDIKFIKMEEVNSIIDNWAESEKDSYLKENYTYKKAKLTASQIEFTLQQLKEAKGWNLKLNAGIIYDTNNKDEELDLQAGLGISKDLYNPAAKLDVKQAKVDLEQAKLAQKKTKKELLFNLETQIEQISRLKENISDQKERLQELQAEFQIDKKEYQQGYLSQVSLMGSKIAIKEAEIQLLKMKQELIQAKINFAQSLNMDNF